MAVPVPKTNAQIAALAPVQSVAGMTGTVTLTTSDISGLDTTLSEKADLVGGYVPSSQIPAIAITEYLGAVADEAAMLALDGDQGDWCIRTDSSTAWVLSADDSTLIGSWIQIPHPQSPVLSVNGQTGVIDLVSSDIGAQAASGTLTATVATTTPTNLTGLLVGNGTDVDALDSTTSGHVLRVASGVKGWGTLDATSIGAGGVDNTEFGYLNGVTSAIQTQIDAKQVASGNLTATVTTATPTNLTGVLTGNGTDIDVITPSTNNRVLGYTTGGGIAWMQINNQFLVTNTISDTYIYSAANINVTKLGTGVVDNTEFNYLNGVTSAIQTQLDSKMTTSATAVLTAQQNFGAVSITSTTNSIAWNLATAQSAKHTFTENTTLANPTNMVDGGTYILRLTQHASSPKTLAFGSAYKWSGGAPTISSTNGAVDIITFTSDGTNMYGSIQKAFA